MKKLKVTFLVFLFSFGTLAQNLESSEYEVLGRSEDCPSAPAEYSGCAVIKLIPSNRKVKIYAGKSRAMTNALVNVLTGYTPGLIKLNPDTNSFHLDNRRPLQVISISQGERNIYEQNVHEIVESQCEQTRGTLESAFTALGITDDRCDRKAVHVTDTGRRVEKEVNTRYGQHPTGIHSVYIEE